MKNKLSNINHILKCEYDGIYYPSFFEINIATSKPFDNDFIQNDENGVFLHEYVHFLQDIYTTYGAANIHNVFEKIKLFYWHLKKTKEENIIIPYKMPEDVVQNKNQELFSAYFSENTTQYVNYEINNINEFDKTVAGVKIKSYSVDIECYNKKNTNIPIGTQCILEGMAKVIQLRHFDTEQNKKDDFTYNIIRKITSYYIPEDEMLDKVNIRKFIILCEISLMYFNSMESFISNLKLIHNHKEILDYTDNDFFEYLKHSMVKDSNNNTICIYDKYNEVVEETIKSIDGVFTSEVYSKIKKWIINFFLEAKTDRSNYSPFLDILDSENYLHVVQKIGFPLYTNEEGELFIDKEESSSNPHILIALQSVMGTIYNVARNCLLCEFCRNNELFNVDEVCESHPWKKELPNKEFCPYRAVWSTFGLEGKDIVVDPDIL